MDNALRNLDAWLTRLPEDDDPCYHCDADRCNDCGLCLDHCECNVRAHRADLDYQAYKEGEREIL